MLRLALVSVAAAAAVLSLPVMSHAQDTGTFFKESDGWYVNQYTQSESTPGPSCSAVHFQDHINAMRVERFDEGYTFGVNGLSRDQQGLNYPLVFWFDGDRSQEAGGEAAFFKDKGYPDDDWLSFFHPIDAQPSPVEAMADSDTMSFAFQMPGNRTGNDEVTSTFDLAGGTAVLAALEDCYKVAASSGTAASTTDTNAQTDTGPCPDDGPQLPLSGLCEGRAVNYLNLGDGERPLLPEGCVWAVNETPYVQDYLLYLAARCNGRTSQLDYAGGARFAHLTVSESAFADGHFTPSDTPVVWVSGAEPGDPERNILIYARDAMEDQAAAEKCHVQSGDVAGLPADYFVVDVSAQEAAKAPQDEPRASCGKFGLDGENMTFWRVFQGSSWFFDLGQDAYHDIDPASLTLVTPDGSSGWRQVE